MGRALRRRLAVLAPLAVGLAVGAIGCGADSGTPSSLLDGSPARRAPVETEGVPIVLLHVTVRDVERVRDGSRIADCLADDWPDEAAGVAVHRVGVLDESITFASPSGRSVSACDETGNSRDAHWCGHAHGVLVNGSLRDPRLDLGGCLTRDDDPVAFVWVEPGPRTRYVVIHEVGFGVAYETAGGLPIRVATANGVDVERSHAVFVLSEHAADGRRLRTYEIEAYVAG
jgi:hypothetical protein